MIDLRYLRGKKIAVMGLGKTGISVARALMEAGAQVFVWDDNAEKCEEASSEGLTVGDLRVETLDDFTAILWSPGIPHTYPIPHPVAIRAQAAHIPLISDIELLLVAHPETDVIAITGTNGKSTTTALTGHILSAFRPTEVGGNIGRPALDMRNIGGEGTYVLELSSYQIELTPSLAPSAAILLNITPDHLERHGGMEGYIKAKEQVFATPRQGTRKPIAVICIDTDPCGEIAKRLKDEGKWTVIPVSTQRKLDEGVYVEDGILFEVRSGEPLKIDDLTDIKTLKGQHNHENAACSYAAIRHVYGIEPDHIIREMKSFGGLPHRQYLTRTLNGVAYINDSKATNADATARALACFHHIYWILGGLPKEGGLNGLDDYMPRIEKAYLIGQAAHDFAKWLEERNVPFEHCETLDNAVKAAHLDAQANVGRLGIGGAGTVLLSPACASWDQFRSFEHRGDVFMGIVTALERDEEK